jgi:hypothetical protein
MTRAWALALMLACAAVHAGGPPLPQRNLSVEARFTEQSLAERQAAGAAGGLVIDSRGNTTVQGGVTLRAGSDAAGSQQVQRVLVLNGGRATLRLSTLTPLPTLELAWIGRTTGSAGQVTWVDVGSGLTVRPSWPGGQAPVRVEVEIESGSQRDNRVGIQRDNPRDNPRGMDRGIETTRVQTELSLPLDVWVTVADVSESSSGNSSAGGFGASTSSLRGSRSLQLRVTAP